MIVNRGAKEIVFDVGNVGVADELRTGEIHRDQVKVGADFLIDFSLNILRRIVRNGSLARLGHLVLLAAMLTAARFDVAEGAIPLLQLILRTGFPFFLIKRTQNALFDDDAL